MGGLAQAEGQVLGRTFLDHVFGFQIAFPVFLVVTHLVGVGTVRIGLGAIDLIAFDTLWLVISLAVNLAKH